MAYRNTTLASSSANMITVYCNWTIFMTISIKKPDANLYQRQIFLTKQINRSAKLKLISNSKKGVPG
jgi:hypothetical protein